MPEQAPGNDPLKYTPRIAVGPRVVHDLDALRAAQRAMILTDGRQDLVAMVPVEHYRAMLARLSQPMRDQPASALQRAVLEQAELDALLAEWEQTHPPPQVPPVFRSRRVHSEPVSVGPEPLIPET